MATVSKKGRAKAQKKKYKDTTKYKTSDFPYDEFYEFARKLSANNVVLISEYNMPDDFDVIWEMDVSTNIDNNAIKDPQKRIRTERLFIYNSEEGCR